ncbi:hypothetical protein JZO70_05225 [Enterococcus sp. 669A]|uniref:Uncharacterized protein n=1 Tax=Candidatus Enterococcus moelleringii TaxID=2815325 RepID=A0ABS3L8Y0_9ENTE|nr:hypothetical protein [Enterococcus sp. 669A]MBO1305550.1 hypothetical protein [Enterococcus sp. 669A]
MKNLDQLINSSPGLSNTLLVFMCLAAAVIVLSVFLIFFKMGDDERSDLLAYKTAAIVLLINCGLNSGLLFYTVNNWKLFLCANFVIAALIGLFFASAKYLKFVR